MDNIHTFLQKHKGKRLFPEEIRKQATASYEALPIPAKKQENWKYIDVSKLFETVYSDDTEAVFATEAALELDSYRLVFLNGNYAESLSVLPSDITVTCISDCYSELKEYIDKAANTDNKFSALNTAYAEQGKVFTIKKSAAVDKPVLIDYINSSSNDSFVNVKNIIIAEENSNIEFIESHRTQDANKLVTNLVTNIFIEDNASVLYSFLEFAEDAKQINSLYIHQKQHSVFNSQTYQFEGELIRNSIFVEHEGEHCETNLNGIYFPSEEQVFDNFTYVTHSKENCTTNENYKGIAKDKGTGIFVGIINVAKGAQKTLADQSNKNILLSKDAKIHSKPQLIIFADDVSCSHGSTTGQIDKDALFYCQARGISKPDAMRLLLQAFLSENIEAIKHPEIADFISKHIEKNLS